MTRGSDSAIRSRDIRPVVLVGGMSRRFGGDKLRHPLPGRPGMWLVDAPVCALREVFGPRVLMVGHCDPAVAARGDELLSDEWPARGPIAGIVSALRHTGTDVFVLAGDLPRVDAGTVRRILAVLPGAGDALCVIGRSSRAEPCVGLYRRGAESILRARLTRGLLSLQDAFSPGERVLVDVEPDAVANVNRVEDLEGRVPGGQGSKAG